LVPKSNTSSSEPSKSEEVSAQRLRFPYRVDQAGPGDGAPADRPPSPHGAFESNSARPNSRADLLSTVPGARSIVGDRSGMRAMTNSQRDAGQAVMISSAPIGRRSEYSARIAAHNWAEGAATRNRGFFREGETPGSLPSPALGAPRPFGTLSAMAGEGDPARLSVGGGWRVRTEPDRRIDGYCRAMLLDLAARRECLGSEGSRFPRTVVRGRWLETNTPPGIRTKASIRSPGDVDAVGHKCRRRLR